MPSTAVLVNPLTAEQFPMMTAAGGATTAARLGTCCRVASGGGAATITAPGSATEGSSFAVLDSGGAAGTNPITVNGNGQLIDGAASVRISADGGFATFVYDDGQWRRLAPRRRLDGLSPEAPELEFANDAAPQGAGAVESVMSALEVDWAIASVFSKTLAAGANAITFANEQAGCIILALTGAASTVSWPATVEWAAGAAPTQTASGKDVYTFVRAAGVTMGSVVQDLRAP